MKREPGGALWLGMRRLAKAILTYAFGAIVAVLVLVIAAPAQAHRQFSAPPSFRPAFASFRTPTGVYTMNADGSGQALLLAGFRFPRWTADGSKLSLVDPTTSSLWVAAGNGTGAVKVSGSAVVTTGAISPDGTHVAYIDTNQQTLNQDLIVANSDGSQPTTLLSLSLFQGLAWSPNSQTLIYSGRTGSGPSSELLFTIPASGGSPSALPISNVATPPIAQPAYSPSGTTIAFDAVSASSSTQVFTAPAAGGAATQVTSGVASAAQPVFSPDGTTILFTGSNPSLDQIYSVPAGGGTATDLTNTTTLEADPAYQPLGQGISGTLTDPNGAGVPGVQVNVSGTDTLGNPVSTQAFTDINGNYSVSLNAGTYSVSPTQPSNRAQGHYVPTTCSGTVSGSVCQGIVLNAGAQATASFKLVKLVVNSTLDTDDPTQAALGICDVTPGGPQQTCTLRQAIEVANTLGGGSITFNVAGGGVPTIAPKTPLPTLSTPITIDGTTQPGAGLVALRPATTVADGLGIVSPGVTVRGMKVDGFASADISIGPGAGSDVIQGDQIDTVPGLPAPSVAAIDEFQSTGHNTFVQDRVGNSASATLDPTFNLNDPQDTVGGANRGQGNTVDGGKDFATARILGPGAVIQGNQFNDAILVTGDGATVGGATPDPGTGAGNVISTATGSGARVPGMDVGSNDVVQGNKVSGADVGILVYGDHDTIGGGRPQLGNQILGNRTGIGIGLTRFGQTPTPSPGNVVQNNQIFGNDLGDGGVAVYDGIGNHIFENEIDNNHAANINLGGGPYRYDTLSTPSSGPNHYQPYPELLDVTSGSTVTVRAQLVGGLAHAQDTYTIDLYAEGTPCVDSVSEGQAYEWLGSAHVRADGIGDVNVKLTTSRSRAQHLHGPAFVLHPAFTVTATAADGSTSELSPCLTLGHRAASFTGSGVSPTSKTIPVTTAPPAGASHSAAAASARPAAKRARPTATLRLLCPPVTIRSCSGSFKLATTARHPITIVRRRFRLAPGQVGSFALAISGHTLASLKRFHRLRVLLTVDARDGGRHRHRKRTRARLTLVLKA